MLKPTSRSREGQNSEHPNGGSKAMNRRLDSDFQSDTAQPVTLNYQLAPNIRRRYIKRNKEKDMASHKYKVNISVDQKQTHEVASAGGCGRTVSKQRGQPSTQPSGDRTPGGGGVFRRTGIRAPFPMPGASGEFHTQEASPGSTPKQSHKPIKPAQNPASKNPCPK